MAVASFQSSLMIFAGAPATTVLGGTSFVTTAPALVSDVYLAWRKSAALSPAATALVDALRGQ